MQAYEDLLMKVYDSAQLAVEFAGGMNQTAFMVDTKTHSAVLYQLLVLGQTAGSIGDDFRQEHPEFPWKAINALSARPADIDLTDAWDILWSDVPAIVTAVESVIPHGGDS
ncbi:MAG: DUF86 domain-containing protein [Phycisphaerae bacterium]|jgi:uncharacterized protein with HEPN domain|nr:DUF86 domain-containing protein [Phycisphaerae bacterium]|tara:strand:- start:114 stop:446 length:333 start_codon:yes stop_codon:yes gene_type:complete